MLNAESSFFLILTDGSLCLFVLSEGAFTIRVGFKLDLTSFDAWAGGVSRIIAFFFALIVGFPCDMDPWLSVHLDVIDRLNIELYSEFFCPAKKYIFTFERIHVL